VVKRSLLVALSVALCALAASSSAIASPSFGFKSFGVQLSGTQAGSHPDLTVTYELNTLHEEGVYSLPEGKETKDLTVELPPGLIGDPGALPQCTRKQFDAPIPECPAETQVGEDTVILLAPTGPKTFEEIPVYNLVPPRRPAPGEPATPAEFGFNLFGIHGLLDFALRGPGAQGYGLDVNVHNITQRTVSYNTTTIWGDPAAHTGTGGVALLSLPTACTGPLHFGIAATSWQEPHAPPVAASTEAPGITGCEGFEFSPSITLAPDTAHAETPAGLSAEVTTPADPGLTSPTERRWESDLRDTTVALPAGVAINPGQVAGLEACQPSQEALAEPESPPSCPLSSRVGTALIETPLLPDRLEGDVYVLQAPPPHLQLLVAASADGVNLKLIGDVHLDPTTGRLTSTFAGTPPLPFSRLKLSFSGGAQAALVTPPRCGLYASAVHFTPWASPSVPDLFTGAGSFAIDAGAAGSPSCPPQPLPFAPQMIAGSSTDQAGAYTGFSMLLTRADGQQRIERLQFKAPPGLVGTIAKVPLCPEPQASQGTCPASSQIGHTVVEAGPGPFPLVVPEPGRREAPIYLTGPYEGQPFGLSIVTPLLAGPFDLGTIVTRASIAVDPNTAQITVTTDPLPQIVDGAPTDLRAIDAVVDRPGFMLNPTDCEPLSFAGTAASAEGATAPLSSRFRVGSCRELGFKPQLGISLSGGAGRRAAKKQGRLGLSGSMKRGGHPSLSTVLTMNGGPEAKHPEANVKTLSVGLPHSAFLDQAHIRTVCTRVQFAAGAGHGTACPPGSVYGHAKAITPLLAQPLEGNVYLRSSSHELPDLVIALVGPPSQPVAVDLDGRVDSVHGGIRTTFEAVPDAPVSKFFLKMQGGRRGLIVNSTNLCASVNRATIDATGQNGSSFRSKVTVVPQCPQRRGRHR
jgi:hypothetical protein